MKEILLIEDTQADAKEISRLILSADRLLGYNLIHLSSLKDAKAYLGSHTPELIILDLEFTEENTTSLAFLSGCLSNLPVIIISHLSHYQYASLQHSFVKAFIRKETMQSYLIPAIEQILFPETSLEPEDVIIPSAYRQGVGESVSIQKIRFIEKIGKRAYAIHLTDSSTINLASVGFADLCHAIHRQDIQQLQPVSRNEIINISCIKDIYRQKKGRIELYLINLPQRPFHVGRSYEDFYVEHFLSHKVK